MAKTRARVLPNRISVLRNDKFLIDVYRNMRENQGEIGRILLKISRKAREVFAEILVSTLFRSHYMNMIVLQSCLRA